MPPLIGTRPFCNRLRAASRYIDVLRSNCGLAAWRKVIAMTALHAISQISIQKVKLPVRGAGALGIAATVGSRARVFRGVATGSFNGTSGVGAASPGRPSLTGSTRGFVVGADAAISYAGGVGGSGATSSTGAISTGSEPNGDVRAGASGGCGSSGVGEGVGV